MFYRYKTIIISVIVSILLIISFFLGMTFGTKNIIVNKVEPVIKKDISTKKVNENITVNSNEGDIDFTIKNVIYSKTAANKKITFDVEIQKNTAFTYLLLLKDEQNQDIKVKFIATNKETKTSTFEFLIDSNHEESDLFLFVYPVSEATYNDKKISDKAYGKVILSITEIKKNTIENLK